MIRNRRSFLHGAGIGGALFLAGCSAQLDDELPADQPGDDSRDNDAQVGMIVHIDEADFEALQQDIIERVEAGEIAEEEAQETLMSKQMGLVEDSVDEMIQRVEEAAVTVDGNYSEAGAIVVSGDPSSLIETLQFDVVSALVSPDSFDEPVG